METRDIIALLAIVVTVLVSSGAVAFIFRYGVRLSVLETLFSGHTTETERKFESKAKTLADLATLQGAVDKRVALVEAAVLEIKALLPELKKIGGIAEKLDQMAEESANTVPRQEIDARFKATEDLIKANARKSKTR